MEMTEIVDGLKVKIKEAKKISGLNSRHFGFKNWHTTTVNLLRNLPSGYFTEINDFKKLAFEDTKYHRGKKFFSQSDNTRYVEDLESAVTILKKITRAEKTEKPKADAAKGSKLKSPKKAVKKTPVKKSPVKKQKKSVTAPAKKAKKPKNSKTAKK